ncbi:hypothetical protein WDV85_14475 [Pseudokineococcus sp. 5B2Z-1]|uniref:hypothetical protein n=1 Tax=Pseudokineococcus sp. 5B2Z-1 TaxID=3132744 RepID=UPI00309F5D61
MSTGGETVAVDRVETVAALDVVDDLAAACRSRSMAAGLSDQPLRRRLPGGRTTRCLVGVAVTTALALSGCTSGGESVSTPPPESASSSPQPLADEVADGADTVCGLISRRDVETAVGASVDRVDGGYRPRAEGGAFPAGAPCEAYADGAAEASLEVFVVAGPESVAQDVARTAREGRAEFNYPVDELLGTAKLSARAGDDAWVAQLLVSASGEDGSRRPARIQVVLRPVDARLRDPVRDVAALGRQAVHASGMAPLTGDDVALLEEVTR